MCASLGHRWGVCTLADQADIKAGCGQAGAHGSGACRRAGSLTLGRLKQLCERLFRLPAARQALAVAGAGGAAARPLDGGDDRDLVFVGLQVGFGSPTPGHRRGASRWAPHCSGDAGAGSAVLAGAMLACRRAPLQRRRGGHGLLPCAMPCERAAQLSYTCSAGVKTTHACCIPAGTAAGDRPTLPAGP